MKTKTKPYYPFLLSISGSGRNSGKTYFACSLIGRISKHHPVVAIKISPHFHKVEYENYLAQSAGKYIIYQEDSSSREKDSSRMLRAGASKVFYIQSGRDFVEEAFGACLDFIPPGTPVICENGGLSEYVEPGLKIFIIDEAFQEGLKLPGSKSDQSVIKKMDIPDDSVKIVWESGHWNNTDRHDII